MKNKVNLYKKENDVSVSIVGTQETLIINPQISHTGIIDSKGEHRGPDELILVISAEETIPYEDRENFLVDPDNPLIINIESMEQADRLIKVLQELRTRIWGLNLDYGNNKN
jgi:hypothetical protein